MIISLADITARPPAGRFFSGTIPPETGMDEEALRKAAFDWLLVQDTLYNGELPWKVLTGGFIHNGVHLTLAGPPGIWKPQCFERIPLSIRTGYHSRANRLSASEGM